MSTPDRLELERQVSDLLKWGLIERSKSRFSSPAFLVAKAGSIGKKRVVYDFRSMNQMLEEDSYDLPTIQEITEKIGLQRPTYLSSFDLSSAYSQVLLEESSRQNTAFHVQVANINIHAQASVYKTRDQVLCV